MVFQNKNDFCKILSKQKAIRILSSQCRADSFFFFPRWRLHCGRELLHTNRPVYDSRDFNKTNSTKKTLIQDPEVTSSVFKASQSTAESSLATVSLWTSFQSLQRPRSEDINFIVLNKLSLMRHKTTFVRHKIMLSCGEPDGRRQLGEIHFWSDSFMGGTTAAAKVFSSVKPGELRLNS